MFILSYFPLFDSNSKAFEQSRNKINIINTHSDN